MANVQQTTFDYIIAGGGLCGSALASRLSQILPNASIALVEAGPDAHDDPLVRLSANAQKLHATPLHWNYATVPQPHLAGRSINATGGRMLSGSSGVNYGTWVRGHEVDYDEWSAKVGDSRWSYKSLLPYFRRTETHYLPESQTPNSSEHGFSGPIKMESAPDFKFGAVLRAAYVQEGIDSIADANSGQPLGVARRIFNWQDDNREPAAQMYDMSKVHILTNTHIHRIAIDASASPPKATGIVVAGGRTLHARKEVIVTLGALRTPTVLMLSGIGPAAHLAQHNIPLVRDLPTGENLHDHPSIMVPLKLRHPEKGFAAGSGGFTESTNIFGELVVTNQAPRPELLAALEADGVADPAVHPLAARPRAHIETLPNYRGILLPPGFSDPNDGSIVTLGSGAFMPTSRGSVRLANTDPDTYPIIDPAYLSTEFDRMLLREAVRQTLRVAASPVGREEIEGPIVPAGFNVSLSATDAEIDEYVAAHAITWWHPAGTAVMGRAGAGVVGGDLKVHGIASLRVADVSVLPDPIGSHYQAVAYAIAERAADLIAADV